ncbi:MAG TPA: DNA polymerase III subunit beta [Flavobacteriales bacterium]|nr:DNA polymerase III subunit beta [Flavobacteriales bacterium]
MQFLVSSDELIKNLQALRNVINNNNTIPVLDNFLFELNNNSLKITASDLETTMTATLPVESNETANFLLPARMLVDTIKALPTQPLTFMFNDNGMMDIVSENGKYSFAYADAADFPNPVEMDNAEQINIPSGVLADAVSKTIFATGNDELRPTMTGILFEFSPESLNFVATDAHKLVKYERNDLKADTETQFIVPKKPLQILKNYIAGANDDVKIAYNDRNVRFDFDNIQLLSRLINGQYPNYRAVIPTENPNVLVADRQSLLNVVKRIAIFANKATHLIQLDIKGSELKVSAEDLDFSNKAEERMTANYQGDDMKIGFNSKFLIEMLSNLDSDEVSINMSMPSKAALIHPIDGLEEGEFVTMLVMPLMLN